MGQIGRESQRDVPSSSDFIFLCRPLSEVGICETYRDIGGDPDPFTAGVIAGCARATSDRACDDGFGFGYLDASRRGATNLCKSGGTASFTSHPDAGHCGGAEPAHVVDLRNVVRVPIRFAQRTVPPSARSSTLCSYCFRGGSYKIGY